MTRISSAGTHTYKSFLKMPSSGKNNWKAIGTEEQPEGSWLFHQFSFKNEGECVYGLEIFQSPEAAEQKVISCQDSSTEGTNVSCVHFPAASLNVNCCKANMTPEMYKQYSKRVLQRPENKTVMITELT